MKKGLRLIILLGAISLFGMWLMVQLNLSEMIEFFNLKTTGLYGYSTMRSDTGSLFLVGAFGFLYFFQREEWIFPLTLTLFTFGLGRTLSLFVDGMSPLMIFWAIFEVGAFIISLLLATKYYNKN